MKIDKTSADRILDVIAKILELLLKITQQIDSWVEEGEK